LKYYLYRLIPPRPSFPEGINREEADAMKDHVAYWTDLANKKIAVVFGPVADPSGAWGVAIVEAEADQQIESIAAADPVIKRNIGFRSEVFPMPNAILRR
jgi:uncharacterized protein YciI